MEQLSLQCCVHIRWNYCICTDAASPSWSRIIKSPQMLQIVLFEFRAPLSGLFYLPLLLRATRASQLTISIPFEMEAKQESGPVERPGTKALRFTHTQRPKGGREREKVWRRHRQRRDWKVQSLSSSPSSKANGRSENSDDVDGFHAFPHI